MGRESGIRVLAIRGSAFLICLPGILCATTSHAWAVSTPDSRAPSLDVITEGSAQAANMASGRTLRPNEPATTSAQAAFPVDNPSAADQPATKGGDSAEAQISAPKAEAPVVFDLASLTDGASRNPADDSSILVEGRIARSHSSCETKLRHGFASETRTPRRSPHSTGSACTQRDRWNRDNELRFQRRLRRIEPSLRQKRATFEIVRRQGRTWRDRIQIHTEDW